MPGEEVATHALITAAIHALEKLRRVRFWRLKIIRPNTEIRVSFSALFRILDGGHYVLVRNLHRPELFGPFGGVFKFYEGGRSRLDELLFRPQEVGYTDDMRNDLRGFLPRKNLSKMLKWFDQHCDRESAAECLSRELREELKEIRLSNLHPPRHLEVKKVRRIEEGPEEVPARSYTQFRIFDVYDISFQDAEWLSFFKELKKISKSSSDLILADSSDIVLGRCNDGRVIGNHCCYLIGNKRTRPEAPHFAKA